MPDSKCKSAASVIALVAALALCLIAAPALATDTVYPVGSRVGLIPPAGMVASDKFVGFNDPNAEAAILINILPAAANPAIRPWRTRKTPAPGRTSRSCSGCGSVVADFYR